jgi:hypothetical protein
LPHRTAIIALTVLVSLSVSAAAAGDFGLGIILGEPTGLSLKQWLTNRTAFDAAAAWSFEDESAFHIHVDYLVHRHGLTEVDMGRLLFYAGVGGRLKLEEEDARLGVRVPLGVTYIFRGVPVDIFLEIVPLLDLAPATDFRMNGGFGIRYFF